MKEINGKIPFDADKYHNQKYNDLLKKLVVYRNEFPKIKEIEGRKQIAKEEFDAWHEYLQSRKEDLPKPDFEIEDKDLSKVREIFDRNKVRD